MPEKEQKLTPEQAREALRVGAGKTLDSKFYQGVLGTNLGQSKAYSLGELGTPGIEASYDGVVSSKEFLDARTRGERERRAAYKEAGVEESPSALSNGDVSMGIIHQMNEAYKNATLGDLERYALNAGAKLEDKVPKEMANLTRASIIRKAIDSGLVDEQGGIDASKLSELEKHALFMYNQLTEAYKIASVVSATDFYHNVNRGISEIAKIYAPKEPKKQ
jgi:hypothetical protein